MSMQSDSKPCNYLTKFDNVMGDIQKDSCQTVCMKYTTDTQMYYLVSFVLKSIKYDIDYTYKKMISANAKLFADIVTDIKKKVNKCNDIELNNKLVNLLEMHEAKYKCQLNDYKYMDLYYHKKKVYNFTNGYEESYGVNEYTVKDVINKHNDSRKLFYTRSTHIKRNLIYSIFKEVTDIIVNRIKFNLKTLFKNQYSNMLSDITLELKDSKNDSYSNLLNIMKPNQVNYNKSKDSLNIKKYKQLYKPKHSYSRHKKSNSQFTKSHKHRDDNAMKRRGITAILSSPPQTNKINVSFPTPEPLINSSTPSSYKVQSYNTTESSLFPKSIPKFPSLPIVTKNPIASLPTLVSVCSSISQSEKNTSSIKNDMTQDNHLISTISTKTSQSASKFCSMPKDSQKPKNPSPLSKEYKIFKKTTDTH